MKKRKIALVTVASLASTPLLALASGVITSCANKTPADDSGIAVSTKEVEVDHNNGVGKFDVILDEQPVDNAAYVYIITAEGPHHVELLDDPDSLYKGHPAVLYGVENGIAHVNIGFTEFVGVSTKTVVGLEVRYNNRKGEWVLKHVNGINVKVTYVHNNIEEVHIFSLNDLHGVAEGYGEPKDKFPATNSKDPGVIRIMNRISPIIDDHPGSFLVTAGDNNSGDMFSSSVHGQSIFKVLQAMGARYSAVGNHAFEWGISPMATYQFDNWGRTPETLGNYFLASNILNGKLDDKKEWVSTPGSDGFEQDYAFWLSQKVGWADPYKIVNMNGHLVCLIGLTTKATIEDGNKAVVDNLSFIDYNAALNYSIYNLKNTVADQLFNSIESFVLLTHIESKMDGAQIASGDIYNLARNMQFEGVDAIISGHSHQVVNGSVQNLTTGKDILIGQAETEGRSYLDLTFRFDNTKPVGQKKISVSQNIVDMKTSFPSSSFTDASADILKHRANPTTETVKNVIKTFDLQTGRVMEQLGKQIGLAYRSDSLLYPVTRQEGIAVGHDYYINQKDATGAAPDGGYIFDQLGAWIGYATLAAFSYDFAEEIAASTAGLTYPAVSLINQDSMKVELPKPASGAVPVKYQDMFAIQTYENTTYFGYLSIFQLAKIIDHSLSGGNGKFNYGDFPTNYYVPSNKSGGTPITSRNNLAYFNFEGRTSTAGETSLKLCEETEFPHTDEYKKTKDYYCNYPCGPVQMYGVRFEVELANGGNYDEEGRMWKLKYIENKGSTAGEYPTIPALYILDPLTDDPLTTEKDVYLNVRKPEKWTPAQNYLETHKYGMIPVITNDFLFNGANWETPMEAVYMKHNEGVSWKEYPVLHYSQITRDLLVTFSELSASAYAATFPFDLPIDGTEGIVDKLVVYPAS